MLVIWINVYRTPSKIRMPVDSNTARVKFTRFLAFCQCGDTRMPSVASCVIIELIFNPVRGTVGVSWNCCYTMNIINKNKHHTHFKDYSVTSGNVKTKMSTGRVDPQVGSGQAGPGRVKNSRQLFLSAGKFIRLW